MGSLLAISVMVENGVNFSSRYFTILSTFELVQVSLSEFNQFEGTVVGFPRNKGHQKGLIRLKIGSKGVARML